MNLFEENLLKLAEKEEPDEIELFSRCMGMKIRKIQKFNSKQAIELQVEIHKLIAEAESKIE